MEFEKKPETTTLCTLPLIYHPAVKTKSDKQVMLCLQGANPAEKHLNVTKWKVKKRFG